MEAPSGYVVKVASGSVYLDLGARSGARAGQAFTVYAEGAELFHPVTHKPLGRIETAVAHGSIDLVMPLYSVGSLAGDSGAVAAGMRARLDAAQTPAPSAQAAPPNADDSAAGRKPLSKGPTLDYRVTGMAIADFRGEGRPSLALASRKTVRLYSYPPDDARPLAQWTLPGVGPRIVSLASGDLNGNGRAELFVTFYNQDLERMETAVLECGADGLFKRLAELPWMVRSYQDAEGRDALAMQQLVDDQTWPFSAIYPLDFSKNGYGPGKPALHFKRVDFLYDFTLARLGGDKEAALLSQTSTNRIRVQFAQGYWKTSSAYGQTPTRLRWHDRLLEFHPQLPIGYADGKAAVYLIRNDSMLGSLAEPFGLFTGGAVEREEWNGIALTSIWEARLSGYCTAAQLVPGPTDPGALAVAVTGSAGRSSVWIFRP
ncbi:MAG: VCBS repeat-containing protein [Elusimicrobia bacterium]|nr:VCBS repeat-containing protein [Elusimicrobiota bacterium]